MKCFYLGPILKVKSKFQFLFLQQRLRPSSRPCHTTASYANSWETNEWRLTQEKRVAFQRRKITRTNNANYLMMIDLSKDQTGMKRMPKNGIRFSNWRWPMRHSCDRAFTHAALIQKKMPIVPRCFWINKLHCNNDGNGQFNFNVSLTRQYKTNYSNQINC